MPSPPSSTPGSLIPWCHGRALRFFLCLCSRHISCNNHAHYVTDLFCRGMGRSKATSNCLTTTLRLLLAFHNCKLAIRGVRKFAVATVAFANGMKTSPLMLHGFFMTTAPTVHTASQIFGLLALRLVLVASSSRSSSWFCSNLRTRAYSDHTCTGNVANAL